ncbi:MAG: COG1361 S-layer family protein [Candidatus Micrarchaeota archaeon]|nr:COG1361 S-layer family protein [Candidatus Micrarchaeota archaeon]
MKGKGISSYTGLTALAVALFYLVAAVPLTAHAAAADNILTLQNLQVSPSPVYSGSNINISFQLYNSYSSSLNNANLQLTSNSQILNVSPGPSITSLSIYQGNSYNTFTFHLHVPATLPAGSYTIDVIATYETSQPSATGANQQLPATSTMPITIYVYGKPNIGLNANPSTQLTPGISTTTPITVVNGGTDTAQNISVTLQNTNNFTVFGPSRFYLGNLAPGSQASITATIQPNQTVQNATSKLNAAVSYTASNGTRINTNASIQFSMSVGKPNIVASLVSAMPQNLYPGSNQTATVLIQNIGTGTARNVTIKFVNSAAVTFGSISSFFIGSLAPQASTTETLYISANRGANSTSASLPAIVAYSTANYQSNVSKLTYIPINMQPAAIFNITAVKGSLAPGATYVPLTYQFKNTGNEPAQQISLSLQTIYPLTPVTSTIYINNLSPGQSANATFYVNVDGQASYGSYPVVVYEQWRQPNGSSNQQFSSSNNYYAVVGSGSPVASYVGYGILIAIVVLAVVFRKRIKKKMAQRKKKV